MAPCAQWPKESHRSYHSPVLCCDDWEGQGETACSLLARARSSPCIKGVYMETLPVTYTANKNAV